MHVSGKSQPQPQRHFFIWLLLRGKQSHINSIYMMRNKIPSETKCFGFTDSGQMRIWSTVSKILYENIIWEWPLVFPLCWAYYVPEVIWRLKLKSGSLCKSSSCVLSGTISFGANTGFIRQCCICWRGSYQGQWDFCLSNNFDMSELELCQFWQVWPSLGHHWKWNVIVLRKRPGTQQDTAGWQAALWDGCGALPAAMCAAQVGEELISPLLGAASIGMNDKTNILVCACVFVTWRYPAVGLIHWGNLVSAALDLQTPVQKKHLQP